MTKTPEIRRLQVKGSAKEPYTVTIESDGKQLLRAYCTCPAGENGQYCKHRFGILRGETKNVVDGAEHIPRLRNGTRRANSSESSMYTTCGKTE